MIIGIKSVKPYPVGFCLFCFALWLGYLSILGAQPSLSFCVKWCSICMKPVHTLQHSSWNTWYNIHEWLSCQCRLETGKSKAKCAEHRYKISCFGETGVLCSPGWPPTYNSYVSTTGVLETQVYTTSPPIEQYSLNMFRQFNPCMWSIYMQKEDCSVQYC